MKIDFSPEILRAGRALTGLSQEKFAAEAEIGVVTLRSIEKGRKHVSIEMIERFVNVLERYDVEYIQPTAEHGAGVRLAKGKRAAIALSERRRQPE
ncbi:helix-turn-helix domain-containing protein [Pseudorhizobium halotolerans]|uniref:helix-turn-helix domain-containing protein n=1 Tax=Pseudorhizobium halotolerans TaxID=1233081 RepID=UPI00115C3C70